MFILPLFLVLAGAVQLIEGAVEHAAKANAPSPTPAPTCPALGKLDRWLIRVLPNWCINAIVIVIVLLCFPAMCVLVLYALFSALLGL